MIPRYRNLALNGIPIGAAMFTLAAVLAEKEGFYKPHVHLRNSQIFILVALMLAGPIAYLWGCFALAKAKGYNGGLVGGAVVICALCCLASSFVLPYSKMFIFGGFTLLLPLVLPLILENKRHAPGRSGKR